MIGHDAFRRIAAGSIDQPLTFDEERELATHRAGCEACRTFDLGVHADATALARQRELVPGAALDRRVAAAIEGARPMGSLSPLVMLAILGIMLVAAVSAVIVAGTLLRDPARLPERPPVPEGWSLYLASSRDVRLALPSYLEVLSLDNSVTANEAPTGSANFLSLIAGGPSSAVPLQQGQSLESWLETWIERSPHGEVLTRDIALPAGRGAELRTVVAEGTPDITQVVVYGILTEDGLAYLLVTGPPADFVNHGADLALIPRLLEAGPALTAALPPEPPGFELRLAAPAGWLQMTAPQQTADGPPWSTFISNAPFPDGLCGPLEDGAVACSPMLADKAPTGTFLLGVIELRGAQPRIPVDAPSLPPTVHQATVAGLAATRTDDLVAAAGAVAFTWEVPSPGEPAGIFVIRMLVSADGYQAVLPQVEAMLRGAEFVARE
jgi:hypothetical protein